MAVIGSAQVLIRPSFSGMNREISRELGTAGERAGETGGSRIGASLAKWGKRGAILAGGAIAGGLGAAMASGFSRLTAIEDAEAMLRGLGHSAENVDLIMQNAMDSTEGTAIRMDKMATTAAQMVAAGIEPGEELEAQLRLVGDAATIAGGDMDGMSQIFSTVAASNRLSMQEVNQMQQRGIPILQMVADEMGVTQEAAREMVSAGEVDFDLFSTAMEENLGGSAQEAGGTMRGSFENLGAYMARFGASLLEGIFPSIKDGINALSGWFESLEPIAQRIGEVVGEWLSSAAETVGNFIQEFRDGEGVGGQFRDVFETVGDVLRTAFGYVKDTVVPVLQDMWGWLMDNKDVLVAVAAGITAARVALIAYNAYVRIAAAVTATWNTIQRILNGTMRANPLGIVITVIGLLVGALVLAWNRSETFRNIVTGAWDAVKNAASAAWDWISDVFDWLMDGLSGVGQWFTDRGEEIVGAWNSVKDGIAAGWNWISDTFDSVKDGLSSVGGWFSDRGEDIKGAWNGVRDGLAAGWGSIRDNVFSAFSDRFAQVTNFFENDSGAIGSTFRWLRDTLSSIWNWIDRNVFSVFRGAFELVRALFSRDSDRISAAWERLKLQLQRAWQAIRVTVMQAFRNAIQGVKDFFSNRVADIRGAWDSLKGAMRSVYTWINRNVFQRFRDGLSWLGDRVAAARDRIRDIWETVANTFRRPINWVIRNVWNDGIASVFNRVADAIGIDTRLNTAGELPMYAKGGHAKKGWALVGEEGPELVRFPQAGYVYTASETAGMLARGGPGTGEDFSESRPPDGGIWGGIANAVGSAVDWVRGGLADLAGAVLDPIVDRIAGGLSGYGSTGDLFGDTMNSAVDSLMDWIRGEDDVMKGILGPGFKESGATGRIQGATAAMNAAAWNIWNAIPGLRGMHSLSQSMVGPHRTGNAVDFYGPSSALQAAAAYAAQNAAQLGIRQVIYNWRLWQGGGWGRLGSTGGNDPGHVWHVHVASHGGGARIWDAPRNIGRPGVYDGGGLLPHGQTALNLSRKPEAVLTSRQWNDVHTMIRDRQAGGDTWNLYGIPMDHAKQTADEIMHLQRVNRRGSVHSRSMA